MTIEQLIFELSQYDKGLDVVICDHRRSFHKDKVSDYQIEPDNIILAVPELADPFIAITFDNKDYKKTIAEV